jgi:hypothetical protein
MTPLSDNEIIALARSAPVVSGWRFLLDVFKLLLRDLTMRKPSDEDLLYFGALKRLTVVSIEVRARNNRPEHIMKGTRLKSWYTYDLRIGDDTWSGRDLNELMEQAYTHHGKPNPRIGELYNANNAANS